MTNQLISPNKALGSKAILIYEFCFVGPCLASANTCNAGFCFVDNSTKTCVCPVGYKDSKCNQSKQLLLVDPSYFSFMKPNRLAKQSNEK